MFTADELEILAAVLIKVQEDYPYEGADPLDELLEKISAEQ